MAASSLSSYFAEWSTVVSPVAIVLAFVFPALVGMFFGYYPAPRAARASGGERLPALPPSSLGPTPARLQGPPRSQHPLPPGANDARQGSPEGIGVDTFEFWLPAQRLVRPPPLRPYAATDAEGLDPRFVRQIVKVLTRGFDMGLQGYEMLVEVK